jgi:hypothetical protein
MLLNWRTKVVIHVTTRRLSDRGAGFVEYAGLLLLIAAVVAGVVGLGIPARVTDAVRNALGEIL